MAVNSALVCGFGGPCSSFSVSDIAIVIPTCRQASNILLAYAVCDDRHTKYRYYFLWSPALIILV